MKNNMSSISLEIFHGKRLELPKSYVEYTEKTHVKQRKKLKCI